MSYVLMYDVIMFLCMYANFYYICPYMKMHIFIY